MPRATTGTPASATATAPVDTSETALVDVADLSNDVRLLSLFLKMFLSVDVNEGDFLSTSLPATSFLVFSFDAPAVGLSTPLLESTFSAAAAVVSSAAIDGMTGFPSETTAGTTSLTVSDADVPNAVVIFAAPSWTSALTLLIDATLVPSLL